MGPNLQKERQTRTGEYPEGLQDSSFELQSVEVIVKNCRDSPRYLRIKRKSNRKHGKAIRRNSEADEQDAEYVSIFQFFSH